MRKASVVLRDFSADVHDVVYALGCDTTLILTEQKRELIKIMTNNEGKAV